MEILQDLLHFLLRIHGTGLETSLKLRQEGTALLAADLFRILRAGFHVAHQTYQVHQQQSGVGDHDQDQAQVQAVRHHQDAQKCPQHDEVQGLEGTGASVGKPRDIVEGDGAAGIGQDLDGVDPHRGIGGMDLVAVDQPDAVQQDGDGHQQGNGAVTDIAGDGAEHHGREDPRDHGADTEDQSQSGTGVVQPGEDEDQTSQHLHRGDDHGSGHLTVSRPLQGGAHIVGYGHVLLVDALDDEEKPDRGAQHHQKDQDIQRTVGGQPVFIKSNLILQPAAEGAEGSGADDDRQIGQCVFSHCNPSVSVVISYVTNVFIR